MSPREGTKLSGPVGTIMVEVVIALVAAGLAWLAPTAAGVFWAAYAAFDRLWPDAFTFATALTVAVLGYFLGLWLKVRRTADGEGLGA